MDERQHHYSMVHCLPAHSPHDSSATTFAAGFATWCFAAGLAAPPLRASLYGGEGETASQDILAN